MFPKKASKSDKLRPGNLLVMRDITEEMSNLAELMGDFVSPCQTCRDERGSVIRLLSGNKLLLVWSAPGIIVVPDKLHLNENHQSWIN